MKLKDKFQKRRLWFSALAIIFCQLPILYFQTIHSAAIGMVVGNIIVWTIALIVWNDDENKYWITRYFDPS